MSPTPDELHSMLWQAVHEYGKRECEVAGLGAATQLLHQIIARHRPDPMPTSPNGKPVFPGWRQNCIECQRRYPCSTVADVADAFGVDWVQRTAS
jgi:hypothetical protein